MSTRLKIALFFVILVIPALLSLVTAQVSFSRASTVEFCGSCHTMTPWFDNVTDPKSDSLAADHYKRRWIQHEQCFTCHSDYGFLGPIQAKINGVRHVVAFYLGFKGRIELYKDFPNGHCLKCHAEAKGFLEDPNHDPIADILSGKDRCVECHTGVHGIEQDEHGPIGYVNGVKVATADGEDKGGEAADAPSGDEDKGGKAGAAPSDKDATPGKGDNAGKAGKKAAEAPSDDDAADKDAQ